MIKRGWMKLKNFRREDYIFLQRAGIGHELAVHRMYVLDIT